MFFMICLSYHMFLQMYLRLLFEEQNKKGIPSNKAGPHKGLVKERKTGKEVRFSVEPEGLSVAAQELSRAATLWDERLQKIKHIGETLHQEGSV